MILCAPGDPVDVAVPSAAASRGPVTATRHRALRRLVSVVVGALALGLAPGVAAAEPTGTASTTGVVSTPTAGAFSTPTTGSRPEFCAEVTSFYLRDRRPTRFYVAAGVPLFPAEHRAGDSYVTQAGSTLTALSTRCAGGSSVSISLLGDARLRLTDGSVVRELWRQTDVLTRRPDGTITVTVSTTRIPLPGQSAAGGVLAGSATLTDGPPAVLAVTFEFAIPCPDGQPAGSSCTVEAASITERADELTTVGVNTIVVRDSGGSVLATIPLGEPAPQFSTDPAVVGADGSRA
ncbi:MAG: hypothetical protein ACRCZD_04175 [Phycicoccus sp.]